jgi:hypothetical protein
VVNSGQVANRGRVVNVLGVTARLQLQKSYNQQPEATPVAMTTSKSSQLLYKAVSTLTDFSIDGEVSSIQ